MNNLDDKSNLCAIRVLQIILEEENDDQQKIRYAKTGLMEFYLGRILNSKSLDNKKIISNIKPFRKYIRYFGATFITKVKYWIYTFIGKPNCLFR